MGSPKSVIDEDISQSSHFLGHLRVIFLFAVVEAGILEYENLPGLEGRGGFFGNGTYTICGEFNGNIHQVGEIFGYRLQRESRVNAFRPP